MAFRAVVLSAGAAAMLSGGAVAEELAAPPPGSSIVAAKREFDAIKAASAGAEQQKLALPLENLPSLDLKTDVTPTPSPIARERQKELEAATAKQSKNWLVDAMERQDDSTSGAKLSRRVSPLDGSSLREGIGAKREVDATPSASKSSFSTMESDKSGASALANPLAKYMGSWMTPKDLALLGTTSDIKGTPADSALFSSLGGSKPMSVVPCAAHDSNSAPPQIGQAAATAASSSPPNPYLDGNAFPSPAIAASPTIVPIPFAHSAEHLNSAPSLLLTEPAPAAQSPAPARRLSKPDSDEKYFKQLKRF